MSLLDSLKTKVEFSPIEDVVIPLLRQAIPEVPVGSLVAPDQAFPFILARRADSYGEWTGDHRFLDSASVLIHTFATDPNGDEDAALLAEAVRVALRDAWLKQTVVPGRGHITAYDLRSSPHRAPDWASATGPVQYADLPTGVHRYEARYHLTIRKPRSLSL